MNVRQHLSDLEAVDLLRVASLAPEIEFQFRHALVQEVAYDSLVRRDRQALHRAVAGALEATQPSATLRGELAGVLAEHFSQGGAEAQALEYFSHAADYAASKYASREAARYFEQAVRLARRALEQGDTAPERLAQLQALYAGWGRALELSARRAAALAVYVDMEALGRAQNYAPMVLSALVAQGTAHSLQYGAHDPARSEALLEEARGLARELDDGAAEAKVLWSMLLHYYFTGRPAEAKAAGEQSLRLARELGLREQEAYTVNDLARVYAEQQDIDRTLDMLDEARTLWLELGNLPMLADSLANIGGYSLLHGDYARCLEAAQEAFEINGSIGNIGGQLNGRFAGSLAHLELGHFTDALAATRLSIELGAQGGDQGSLAAEYANLGWALGMMGDPDEGVPYAERGIELTEHLPLQRPWTAAVLARLRLMQGDVSGAEAAVAEGYRDFRPEAFFPATMMISIAEAHTLLAAGQAARALERMEQLLGVLDTLKGRGMRPEMLYLKGLALRDLQQTDEARKTLAAARNEAEYLQSRRMLGPILFALSQLEEASGNRTYARRLRGEAMKVLNYVAEHIDDPELRRSFLNLLNTRGRVE